MRTLREASFYPRILLLACFKVLEKVDGGGEKYKYV